ncbi:dihydrofolate reductase family protein [Streptomyces sp. NPDC088910]|uniref:dihydrofolate reductase family protein n=1 Tax=Streptomyces sp. NPDC088910 TaxID=3365911 RepID=UPI00382006B6
MTRTQYYTATTLDGFLADEANSLDWLFEVDTEPGEPFERFIAGVGVLAMGATTYRWVLEHEKVVDRPEEWRRWYGDRPCWVFTHRDDLPAVPGADIRFVQGDVRPVHGEMVAAAREGSRGSRGYGENVWLLGGGELVGNFADAGLLDDIILGVAPVTLGAGAPLLPRRLDGGRLRLTDVERVGQFAYLTYEVGQPVTPSAGGGGGQPSA